MEKTPSNFAPLRNAKDFDQVMDFLAQDNVAAIIEALRSERWASQLFPRFISHENHVVRYEIACSSLASQEDLSVLKGDSEMIVRQAATQNLLARKRPKPVAPSAPEPAASSEMKPKEKAPKTKGNKKKRKLIRDNPKK